jgi:hypothetical protein
VLAKPHRGVSLGRGQSEQSVVLRHTAMNRWPEAANLPKR